MYSNNFTLQVECI